MPYNVQWLSENIKLISGIVTGSVVIIGVAISVRKRLKNLKESVDKLLSLPEEVAGLKVTIEEVKHQVLPNGGSSFRDAVAEELALIKGMSKITRNHLEIPTYECDPDGLCVDASPALCKLFGLSREEMLGNGWTIAIEDDNERTRAWSEWSKSVRNDTPYRTFYRIVNQSTGKKYVLYTTANAIKTASGKLIRFVGNITSYEELAEAKPVRRRRAGAGAGQGETAA